MLITNKSSKVNSATSLILSEVIDLPVNEELSHTASVWICGRRRKNFYTRGTDCDARFYMANVMIKLHHRLFTTSS